MNITVIGTGYVGLVTGACFAEMGNHVVCVDIDQRKIDQLKAGVIPIYEPGLDALVKRCINEGLLEFTIDLSIAMSKAQVFFIAVGTPPGEDGSADLSHVLAVAKSLGEHLTQYAVIVDKSTVPVGTAEKVKETIHQALLKRKLTVPFDVVSNPEFLKEGAALDDFMRPDRIVIGVDSEEAQTIMEELYAPFGRIRDKVLVMSVRAAEMTKYAANAMLATKISFMNEMATLCERMEVDVEQVRRGIGSDQRIGYSFIYPGCGYGGSCFPKDVKALIQMAIEHDFDPVLLKSVELRNTRQKRFLFEKVSKYFGDDLTGRVFAVWGLAFKPGTDDVREASSLVLIEALIKAGASVKAYDPVASQTAANALPAEWIENRQVQFCGQQYDVIPRADALILVTEWKFFRQPDFECLKHGLKQPVIFDGRNQYDPIKLKEQGFVYFGIGRETV